jgi:MFS family permease
VIVASASGGFAGAIVLYETALGVGIAMGPLIGGSLGEISWRGPFFGVSVLMAIALIAVRAGRGLDSERATASGSSGLSAQPRGCHNQGHRTPWL